MRLKISVYRIIVILITIYMIGSLSYTFIDSIFPLNQIVGAILTVAILYCYLRHARTRELLFLTLLVVLAVLGVIQSSELSLGLRDGIYWLVTILCLLKFSDKGVSSKIHNEICNHTRFIKLAVYISDLLIIIPLITGTGYNSSWGGRYFVGYSYSNHVMASGTCLLLVFTLYIIRSYKGFWIKFILTVPGIIAVLESGARTYLLSVIIIYILFYFYNVKSFNLKIILFPMALIIAVYVILNSAIMEKFINPNAYFANDGMNIMTAGRSVFWLIDLNAFKDSTIIKKLIGNGFDFRYQINLKRYGFKIWSHNDFINTLLTSGLIGLTIYLYAMLQCFKKVWLVHKGKIAFLSYIYFLGVAFVNGLFGYQHYLYSFLILITFLTNTKESILLYGRKKDSLG